MTDKSRPVANDRFGDSEKPAANDNHTRLVDEFLNSKPAPAADKTAAPVERSATTTAKPAASGDRSATATESGAGSKPVVDAETVSRNLATLEQRMRADGLDSGQFKSLRENFDKRKSDGTLPSDLKPINDMVDSLSRKSAAGALPTQTQDVMLRLINANLDGKVDLVTPENFKQKTDRPVFNRENPEYGQTDTNCRACTASYIINESLSERALMKEFDKLLEKVESGKDSTTKLSVPMENGMPRMTATLFQRLHGNAFEGIAGEKFSQREIRDFQTRYKTVQQYIEGGLKEAGFSGASLPGGDLRPGRWPPTEPGFYVLEHASSDTSGQVSGHVTAAYVDKDLKVHRIDSQNPENRTKDWKITQMYKLEFGQESSESTGTRQDGAKTFEVTNSDSTIRNIAVSEGKVTSYTDLDGRGFQRDADGKWKTTGPPTADAPFKDVEYLGKTDGFKFTYENYTVTERPDGTARIEVPNRPIMRDGKPIMANGQEVKFGDVIESVQRTAQGRIIIEFKDKSSSTIEPPGTSQIVGENSRVGFTRESLAFLDGAQGTTGGGKLDNLIGDRVNAEIAKGSSLETAVAKLTSPGIDDAAAERRSRLAAEANRAKLPTDPTSLSAYDRVLGELNLPESEIKKAGEVVERAKKHLADGVLVDKKPVDAKQALDLAILENMSDPTKDTGKNMRLPTAQKKLREFSQFRGELNLPRVPEPTLRQFLQTQQLVDRYQGELLSAFESQSTSPDTARGRLARLSYMMVRKPEQLKAAEELLPKLKQHGGDRAGLADAFAMVTVPGLAQNPELAVDLQTRSGYIRNQVSNHRGTGSRQWTSEDYLKLAKILKEDGKPITVNINDIENAERKFAEDERKARADAEAREGDPRRTETSEIATKDAKPESAPKAEIRESAPTDTTPPRAPAEIPFEPSRIFMFKSKIAGLEEMPSAERCKRCITAAQDTLFNDVNRSNRMLFKATKLEASETDRLKPGESELVFSKNGKPLNVVSIEFTGAPTYVTADGTKVPATECSVEVHFGKGSTAQQVAAEALVRANSFKEILEGKASGEAARQANAESVRALLQGTRGPTVEGSGLRVVERVIPLGVHEFKTSRVEVALSERGVKFGGDKMLPYEQLVKDTLQEKINHRDRLSTDETAVMRAEIAEQLKLLNEQIVDLQHLRDNLHRPGTTTRLMETIGKHATPAEIEKLRAEIAAGRGGAAKGAVARAGAYAIVAGFVTNMLANGQTPSYEAARYAPTSSK